MAYSKKLVSTQASQTSIAASPYQSKQNDPYSSHSVILRLAGRGAGKQALDVGAAHGYLATALHRQGYRVTGIEADSVLAEEAAKHCDEFFVLNLDGHLPGFARLFDLMVFGDVLEHLKDPLAVLRTLAESLRDDGRVIISLPNVANIYVRLSLLFGQFNYQDRGILDRTHLHFYTRRTFLEFMQQAGFVVEELTATPIPLQLVVPARFHGRIFKMVHGLNAFVARTWQTMFGYQFVALARKVPEREPDAAA